MEEKVTEISLALDTRRIEDYRQAFQLSSTDEAEEEIFRLMHETVLKKLDKIGRCPVCGKAFFKGYKGQKYCCLECNKIGRSSEAQAVTININEKVNTGDK